MKLDYQNAKELFLNWRLRRNDAVSTRQGVACVLKNHLKPFLTAHGIDDLRKMTRENIELLQKEIVAKPWEPSTKHHVLQSLRVFFKFLAREGLILFDLTGDFANLRRPPRRLPVILSEKEMEQLLNNVSVTRTRHLHIRDRAVLELLYSTGLRLNEIRCLKVAHIDVKNGFVFVESGKGAKDRVVPLGEKARVAIGNYLEKLRPVLDRHSNPHLFLSCSGRPLDGYGLRQILTLQARAVGLKKRVYPHLIRHTMATHLMENGASLPMVQSLLGHEDLRATQIYTHLDLTGLRKIFQKHHPRGKWIVNTTGFASFVNAWKAEDPKHLFAQYHPRGEWRWSS